MKVVKRGWRVYHLYRKDEETLFLEKAKELVWSLPPPYEERQTGRRPYNPRGMAMIALLKMKFKKDYRSLESHLRARRDLLKIMELDEAPSKSTIHLTLKRMPEPYLKKLKASSHSHSKREPSSRLIRLLHQALRDVVNSQEHR